MADLPYNRRNFWNERNRRSLYIGVLFLLLALYIQAGAGNYSDRSATRFVGDVFLDNLPTIDLTFLIVEGSLFFVVFIIILLFLKPRYIIFSVKAASLFIIIRSFFVILTHLGIYPNPIVLDSGFFDRIYAFFGVQGGFFFSGHTGMPILIAIIFWKEKFWRWFFIGISVIMGAAVLLAHIHYSIDVFAAPFMAYGIFKIAEKLFSDDYKLVRDGLT